MFVFIFFFILFLSFLSMCLVDYVLWWSIFVVSTFVFIFFLKNECYYGSLVSYYIVQEVSGYYFLVFSSWKFQFVIIMIKAGVAPFYFWLFGVVESLSKWYLMWFLTFQKLPYFFVMVNFYCNYFFYFLLFGVFVCYLHFFLLRGFLDMLVVFSVESFSWLLMLCFFSGDFFFYVFFYYFIMIVSLPYVYKYYFSGLSLELVLIFFNIPLSVTFLLKLLLMGEVYIVGYYYFYLLFFMVLISMGISFWFFYVSMINNIGVKFNDYFFFVFFSFMLLSYF
uniref:NADH dehydrogenase subunit 2 n=1 Tax=Neofoleyellides sp. XM-2022 TaxID=3014012 RepID=A0A9E9FUC2_9BILA|nr:NADH dehydrogenase subunit 2 [Neofoleyellides sp. XM-2022]